MEIIDLRTVRDQNSDESHQLSAPSSTARAIATLCSLDWEQTAGASRLHGAIDLCVG